MDPTEAHEGQQVPMGTNPQAAGQPAIPLEVLQDRYEGLLLTDRNGEATALQVRLWKALERLISGVARRDVWGGNAEQLNGADMIVEELGTMIREHIVRRVHETGVAR